MNENDLYAFIRTQETEYKKGIPINDAWTWSMHDHIKTSVLYTNSQLNTGKTEFKPVKNITRPILNLQHRTEDIEVKDVVVYVNDPDKYHLSFLVKKYHDDVFTAEYDLDTYFDKLNTSRIDLGGGLSKQLDHPCPEVVPLESIAFCDQTDMLSGPIGIKHYYSPDQLLEKAKVGWGDAANGATITLEDLIRLARDEKKSTDSNAQTAKTPGRYIEVYEIHGNLPARFFDYAADDMLYETRIAICAFYQSKDGKREQGVILYTALEPELPFKLVKRDEVYGRALGFGGAEELFEAQVWVNYDMIRINNMLDAAAVTIMGATGANSSAIAKRNDVQDMKNMEILDLADGKLERIDTFPTNVKLFYDSITLWEEQAKTMGAAQDPIQGKTAPSGTPFAAVQAQIMQGMGLHDYRRGQFAKHLEEVYRDWIIPYIEKKIVEGATFLSELSLEELQYVGEAVITNTVNARVKDMVLAGEEPTPDQVQALRGAVMADFKKRGNKHFIEILKGEFKNTPLAVKVDIAGKSKDLSQMVDKLTNVFRTVIANPYILQSPPIAELFNKIIQASGLDPIDLTGFTVPALPTRTMREVIDFKDLPPTAQQGMLQLAGIESVEGEITPPVPAAPQPAAQYA